MQNKDFCLCLLYLIELQRKTNCLNFSAHLMQQLDDYMSSLPKVRIVRATRREGLIRARLIGARYVTAPILTYLDSHCECTEGMDSFKQN